MCGGADSTGKDTSGGNTGFGNNNSGSGEAVHCSGRGSNNNGNSGSGNGDSGSADHTHPHRKEAAAELANAGQSKAPANAPHSVHGGRLGPKPAEGGGTGSHESGGSHPPALSPSHGALLRCRGCVIAGFCHFFRCAHVYSSPRMLLHNPGSVLCDHSQAGHVCWCTRAWVGLVMFVSLVGSCASPCVGGLTWGGVW